MRWTRPLEGTLCTAQLEPRSMSEAVSFTVRGKVQKVFFRKCTQAEASRLGITGWVMNTRDGTVVGMAQGPPDQMAALYRPHHAIHATRS